MSSDLKRRVGVSFTLAVIWIVADARSAISEEPALKPLELKATPTITCIGVQWDVSGDDNINATGTLEFREAGSPDWQSAFPLRRSAFRPSLVAKLTDGKKKQPAKGFGAYSLEHYRQNYLAGSIFGLKPGTKYEVRVTLKDPDGGGATKTLAVTTRSVPAVPKDGHIVEVRGGGDALKKAAEKAEPGDTLRVHAGKYEGGIVISSNGTAEKPISIVAAGDGEVLLHGGNAKTNNIIGISVNSSFIYIEGVSFYNFMNCVRGQRTASNLTVVRCKMNYFYTAIRSRGDDGYFADNVIRESYHPLDETVPPDDRNEGHGIELTTETSGVVACYNQISLVADGFRAGGRDSDIYGNDVIFNIDDGIELDFGGTNLRVMDNLWSFTGQNGISFQPYIGGPAFIVRNLVIGSKENALKNRYEADGAVFINNTLLCFDGRANDLPYRSYTRNNLFLTNPGKGLRSARVDVSKERVGLLDMDYDGFGPKGPNGLPLSEFTAQTGLEKHGLQFTSNDQVLAKPPGTYPQYMSKQWTVPEAFLKEKGRPHPDLSLKAGSPAIGAGITIPNIMQRADGKAPDLGALQYGLPMPHYGPRP